jgi:hypothetical protein
MGERKSHLSKMLTFSILVLALKMVQGLVNVLITADNTTRRENGHKIFILVQKTNKYKYSFFPHTIPQWKCLPNSLIDSDDVDAFKH